MIQYKLVIIDPEKWVDQFEHYLGVTPNSFLQILGEKVDKNEQQRK